MKSKSDAKLGCKNETNVIAHCLDGKASKRTRQLFVICFVFLGIAAAGASLSFAMSVEDINTSRRVDWSQAGYPGNIPTAIASITTVTNHGVTGDGATDDHDAIQALIDSAVTPAVLFFPAGRYRIESILNLKAGVVLRGEGSTLTHLDFFSASGCFNIKGRTSGSFVAIQSGLQKGSNQIVVANNSSFQAGKGGMIRQEDIDAVDPTGAWADSGWVPEYVVGQMVKILAVNGNTLTISPPLNISFTASKNPQIQSVDFIQQVGIEHLHINRINTGDITNNVNMDYAADCWIKAVESAFTQKYHFAITRSLHLEIRECYLHDALSKGDGGQGYGVSLSNYATAVLVENNIFNELRHSMIIQIGVNGCVFGYNYAQRNYSDDGWDKAYIAIHGHYPYMNLFEGNVIGQVCVADYWGASGPGNTLFRNKVMGTDKHADFGLYRGILVDDYSHQQNIIGNELIGTQTQITFDGYTDQSSGTSDDVIVHGNNVHGTNTWDSMFADHILPPSFYLASKPEFYGSKAWPSLGGDQVLGVGTIPAEDRFSLGDYIPRPSDTSPPAEDDPPADDTPPTEPEPPADDNPAVDDDPPTNDGTSPDDGQSFDTGGGDSDSGGGSGGGCFICVLE